MRTLSILLLLLGCGIVTAQEPPYEARIKDHSTVVHSAPSKRAYATQVLSRGSSVEVYRHDPGGWCAIRPPAGSFCLVPADAVQVTEEPRVGRVIREGVKAWVGTRISNKDEAIWQVKLAEGELVELLAGVSDEADGEEPWCLIAPPAGEFRWVHESHLERDVPPSTVTFPDAPRTSVSSHVAEPLPLGDSSGEAAPRGLASDAQVQPTVMLELEGDGFTARQATGEGLGGESSSASGAVVTDESVNQSAVQGGVSETAPVSAQIVAASQMLSDLLLDSPEVSILELGGVLQRLGSLSLSVEEREQVDRLSARLERFQELALRREALARLADRPRTITDVSGAEPLDGGERGLGGLFGVAQASREEDFKASGLLSRLVRSGGLEPSGYAIQSETGKIEAIVYPSPGVNLERYLRKNVGVIGRSSRDDKLGVPRIEVERVVLLK